MIISRKQRAVLRNTRDTTLAVVVDEETFLVPPSGYLQTTGGGDVYLAFAGDAPMIAVPLGKAEAGCTLQRA